MWQHAAPDNQHLPVTVLAIHGVGDAPSGKTRSASERLIRAHLGAAPLDRVLWYDWNEAIDEAQPGNLDYLQAVAHGTRAAARLEFPNQKAERGIRAGVRLLDVTAREAQLPLMALFLWSCLWLGLAWSAGITQEQPPPLVLDVRLQHVFFPPLDPVLLKHSLPFAQAAVGVSASAALVLLPVLQLLISAVSGAVPFRVALRCVLLDITRPLLALLTAPGPIVVATLMLGGVLALWLAIFSRPVQVMDMDGNPITYGGDRAGLLLLPLALLVGSLVIGATSFLLRGFLKVVSDITRYLGTQTYRQDIHAHLSDKVAELEPGPVLIVAHSLGSVIAVDSLLAHPETWSRFPRVCLLTCGSPLARLFHRFFPASYLFPDALLQRLQRIHRDFRWRNAFRPLDYIGGRLSSGNCILETRLRQRGHLHIAYWSDPQFAQIIASETRFAAGPSPAPRPVQAASASDALALDRIHYGSIGGERPFRALLWALLAAGCASIVAVQSVVVPGLERAHLLAWSQQLEEEGRLAPQGLLCPQREHDISEMSSSFRRAVAGIEYRTADGSKWILEAYADSRPDIDWDEVQRAVFGRVPDSPLVAGLKAIVFFWREDPLLEVESCQPVSLRYAVSDPRIFRLSEKFHSEPVTGTMTRIGRILGLIVLWWVWWWLVAYATAAVLGVAQPVIPRR